MKIGIGISTYGRRDVFNETFEAVLKNSRDDSVIVVSDDGSPEGAPDVSKAPDVVMLSNKNGGIARNKNRLLANLFMKQNVDVAILLEDDVRPIVKDWEDTWGLTGLINGASFWAHGDFPCVHAGLYSRITNNYTTGQCIAISKEAFWQVGYIDPRFTRYGFEHAEWQNRMAKMGIGGIYTVADGYFFNAYDFHSLENIQTESTGNEADIGAMREVFFACHHDTGWKNAWTDDADRVKFLKEACVDLPVNV